MRLDIGTRMVQRVPPVPTIIEARKLEHGFRRIGARIPYTLP